MMNGWTKTIPGWTFAMRFFDSLARALERHVRYDVLINLGYQCSIHGQH